MVNSEASDQTHKRLFIGIRVYPTDNFLDVYSYLKLNINKLARVKWTPPENFHFTLWFLGKTPTFFINTLNMLLAEIAYEGFKFELCINQIGTFGGNKPRILWAGIEESEPLTMLYNKINTKLEILGFEKEVGPYHPHLTLGRIKSVYNYNSIQNLISEIGSDEIQRVTVDKISLFESKTYSSGAQYEVITSHPMAN